MTEALGKINFMNSLHLFHFLIQRDLLLANQKFKSHLKITCPLIWSSVGWREGRMGEGLRTFLYAGLWLDVDEETTASNYRVGCNFKPFRGHTVMTAIKNEQYCDYLHLQKMSNRSFV